MLEMLRDLVAHKGFADAAVLNAIKENLHASSDRDILDLLHHVLLANRFWVLSILDVPFVLEDESRQSSTFDELIHRFSAVHRLESAWIQDATNADLERRLTDPRIPGGQCQISQAIMQVCLHSQGHRAQCAKWLRQHGGTPPQTDFILWLNDRRIG